MKSQKASKMAESKRQLTLLTFDEGNLERLMNMHGEPVLAIPVGRPEYLEVNWNQDQSIHDCAEPLLAQYAPASANSFVWKKIRENVRGTTNIVGMAVQYYKIS